MDTIDKLPRETMDIVLNNLEMRDVTNMLLVSKTVNEMVKSSRIWIEYCRAFGLLFNPGDNCYEKLVRFTARYRIQKDNVVFNTLFSVSSEAEISYDKGVLAVYSE